SYQAVIRNASNNLVVNQSVGMQISILQGSASGTAVYVETQTPSSNANGLVSIEIGAGNVVSGSFTAINWANGPYFIKTETDPAGGTTYSITGTSQLLSVPYALHAKTAESVTGTSSNNFYLGQDTLGGIVFYIYLDQNGNQHGLIVSKTETAAQWQSAGTTTGATRSWDGVYNTGLMTNSPAKTWVTSLGAGWYLPSIDELSILWHNRFHVNKALNAAGATLLSNNADYWSSTEYDATYAFHCPFPYGHPSITNKTFTFSVRAVRAF
ncbi:MAG: DUF1566 domain-containing protein, partial [Bacteroidia bacterium]|nr:DUF1566 domain-containing protein [Bacteroidia bacterium]